MNASIEALSSLNELPLMLGLSDSMRGLSAQVQRAASACRTTLIAGPTGSGKEIVARSLHAASARATKPFVAIDCGALTESMLESELFGHARGAFTGAAGTRSGLIRKAGEGTLFLDEINSMPLSAQTRFLRFLESGEYRAVGSDTVARSGAWVIAATNEDLRRRVEQQTFREDLLYRLELIRIDVPPLSERGEDVLLLASHFLRRLGVGDVGFSRDAERALMAYDWPGNVRELKHRVEAAAFMATGPSITPEDLRLPAARESHRPSAATVPVEQQLWGLVSESGMTLGEAIAFCEEAIIREALRSEEDNRTRAAERLGIHVRTIFKKLQRR